MHMYFPGLKVLRAVTELQHLSFQEVRELAGRFV